MTHRELERMSKGDLIRELQRLEAGERRVDAPAGEADRDQLVHELHVHQVELEMQNRELRDAQQRLEEVASRYADLYDFAPIGYCTLDPEGCIDEINLTGAALLGAPRHALVGNPFVVVAPLQERRPFRTHMRRCEQAKGTVTSEIALLDDTRGEQIVQLVSDRVRDANGETIGYRTMLVDITELKALEARLRLLSDVGERLVSSLDSTVAIEAAARTVVPALADLCMIDVRSESGVVERLVVIFADPEKQRLLGERMTRVAPRPGWEAPQARVIATGEPMLLSELSTDLRDRIAYDDAHASVLKAADVRSIMVLPLRSGTRIFGALTFASGESGRRYSTADLEVAQDVARRVGLAMENARLYDEAQRAVAARDAMLSVVSHDLRNPLGVILFRAELMLKFGSELDKREESRKSMEVVRRTALRMNRLIQDLLDVGSIEAGRFSVERTLQPASALVREVVDDLRAQAAAKSVALTCDVADVDAIDVDCDRDRIAQVLGNLVENALKFTPQRGAIVVRAVPSEADVCVSVADSGPGIPADALPQVFDRFWQAKPSDRRQGSGLGLSICKGIVEAHGGRIWAESRLGQGSTFFFTLPRSVPAPNRYPAADPPQRASSASRGTVLIADDDPDAREALRDTVEQRGYVVAMVENGAEALAYLRRAPHPALILLDLGMPVMDGWAFLAERNRDPDLHSIPVIVVSGERDVRERIADADADYLEKPVRPDRLLAALDCMVH